jgi:hypothetical protein
MRDPLKRHLASLLVRRGGAKLLGRGEAAASVVPEEMNPHDYVAYLLTIDAEIEHALMVQYLYAGWSLGGPQVPEDKRSLVLGWQTTVLGVAKEEMGHLISVQNVLRLIGAPLYLGREDYPWDSPFYPFPFMLAPASLDTLAKYVYAESPPLDMWRGPLQDDVLARIKATVDEPSRVGALFDLLIGLVKDPEFLPDSVFDAGTYPFQADFAEWGRGYGGNVVPPPGAGRRPDVLVVPAASRDDAVAALQQIAEQGEATSGESRSDDEPPSHFARFVEVYRGVEQALNEGWMPYRDVAVNPYIPAAVDDSPEDASADQRLDVRRDPITDPEAQLWAHLFNVRYRLLLQLLEHSFQLVDGHSHTGIRSPRGAIINATFGEMYNLRAIAHILMQSPLGRESGDRRAGPPFQVPYTFSIPHGEANRWRGHRDLFEASAALIGRLRGVGGRDRQAYLTALHEADSNFMQTIDRVLHEQTR